jgi:predicted enzyme related to lactoylglutathione lyase
MFYTYLKQDGETIAGLGGMQEEGMPSYWNNYIAVEDASAIASKITELGGTVLVEPMQIFDSGIMMVAQDPTGAIVGFWQALDFIGASLVNIPGAMTWNELLTRDVDKAKEFYTNLLGWEYSIDEASAYISIVNKGRFNGGIMQMGDEWGEMPPNWTAYFAVNDIDALVEKAKTLGGRINTPIIDAAGVGRFASVSDPTGATCTFMQLVNIQGEAWKE